MEIPTKHASFEGLASRHGTSPALCSNAKDNFQACVGRSSAPLVLKYPGSPINSVRTASIHSALRPARNRRFALRELRSRPLHRASCSRERSELSLSDSTLENIEKGSARAHRITCGGFSSSLSERTSPPNASCTNQRLVLGSPHSSNGRKSLL